MDRSQFETGNSLLSALGSEDYERLRPHLKRIMLPRRFDFYKAGEDIENVYFPENGIVSVVAVEQDGRQAEIGIIGREGFVGIPVVLGARSSPHHVYMQVDGASGLRLSTVRLHAAIQQSADFKALLLRYVQTFLAQSASSTSAAAGYTIEPRLARWLLMYSDRLSGPEIRLTHASIALMLATRRAGVTTMLQKLEGRQLITTQRGSITVTDRPGLIRLAGGSYGLAEAEYARVMGFGSEVTGSAQP